MNGKPASVVISDDIRDKINQGILKHNDLLPSEKELCVKYGVSRVTAQKAFDILENEFLIRSVPGKGHYVNNTGIHFYHARFKEFDGFDVRMLSVDIIEPPPEVIYHLRVNPKKRVPRIIRMAYKDGRPAAYDIKYIPYTPGVPVIESETMFSDFEDLIYNIVSPYEVENKMEIFVERGSAEICARLGMPAGIELLRVEQLLVGDEGVELGWSVTYYNPAYFRLDAERI